MRGIFSSYRESHEVFSGPKMEEKYKNHAQVTHVHYTHAIIFNQFLGNEIKKFHFFESSIISKPAVLKKGLFCKNLQHHYTSIIVQHESSTDT